jgi:ribosome-binding protein aMBF1 (putative translation factor)
MTAAMNKNDFGAFLDGKIAKDTQLKRGVNFAESDLRIAEELYKLRTSKGLTQSALAKAIGTTQSVIARLEDADYSGYTVRMLQRIALALDVVLDVRFVTPNESIQISTDYVEPASFWPETVPTKFK